MAPVPTLPAHAATWPAPVRAALGRRAESLAGELAGDVFDLAALDGGRARWPSARFDTVVSLAELGRFADLAAVAGEIRDHLAPGGRLVVVEPSARAGLRATLRATIAARRAAPELHLDRDIPWDLHRCGWRFFRVERDVVAGAPWGLRFLATGVAGPVGDAAPTPTAAIAADKETTR